MAVHIDGTHQLSDHWATEQSLTFSLVTLLSVIGNGLVCCLLLSRKQHLTPSSRFVLSLCGSNFAVSVLVLPFGFVSAVRRQWDFGDAWCSASAFLWLLVTCASNITLAAIALDRYCAIVRPMSYSVTGGKSTVIVVSVWMAAFALCLVPLVSNIRLKYQPLHAMCLIEWRDSVPYSSVFVAASFVFPALVISLCYGRIFRIACSKYEKIRIRTISALVATGATATPVGRTYARKPSWLASVLQSPVKGLAVICAILGSFFISWTPYAATVVLHLTDYRGLEPWQQRVAFLVSLLSLPSHPFVYGLLNRSIRKNLLAQFLGRRSPKPATPTARRRASPVGLLDYTPPPVADSWTVSYHSTDVTQSGKTQLYALCNQQRKASEDSGRFSMQSDETVASTSTVTTSVRDCQAKDDDNWSSDSS